MSVVFVAFLFASAWGGTEVILIVCGICCLISAMLNFLAASNQPSFRWLGGLILAGPIAGLIILNGFINPHEASMISFWLTISLAIYISSVFGGLLGAR